MITQANLSDIDELVLLMKQYVEESVFKNLTFDPINTADLFRGWITEGICFVFKVKEKIIAFAALMFSKTFYEETIANNDVFYVSPEYRGKGIGRILMQAIVKTCDDNEVKTITAASISGIGGKNDKLFCNTLEKFGFKVLGTCMLRS